ncbi:hypothetical protein JCM10207_006561 [Rhodosporidiobolus poonsookiae]
MSSTKMKVAAVQAEPCWLDVNAGIDKAIRIIKEAAANGAELVGFPECFIPGFPHCVYTGGPDPEWVLKYQKNSIALDSPEFERLRRGVKEAGVWVIMGFSERLGGSIYMAQSFIAPNGDVPLTRRKFKPTHAERYLWGEMRGDSLQCTVKTEKGVVIGGLECWEHMQPLLRFYEYSQGVQVHVASWPHLIPAGPNTPWHSTGDASANTTSFMALEGGCFTLCCTQVTSKEGSKIMNIPVGETAGDVIAVPIEGGGFSAIFGPDGRRLTDPIPHTAEAILYADIDLDDCLRVKQMADCVGHYSRPELLSLYVNNEHAPLVRYANGSHVKNLTDYIPPLL